MAAPGRSGTLGGAVRALVAVSRPWFWPVSWVPVYIGTVVAGGAWLPAAAAVPDALLAFLVVGPLTWGAVLAQNDLHDLPSDRNNARKATAPLVSGLVSVARLTRWCRVLMLCAVGAALVISALFALGVVVVLLLGWAYSAPPLRLKTRPGADVAVNAVVVGVLAPLAGWSLSRPPWEFPWVLGGLGLLFTAAFYLPSTVTDLAADGSVGDTTFAVRYGRRFTYRLGVGLWGGALVGSLVCAYLQVVVPGTTVAGQLVMAPVLLVAYAVLTRRPSIFRLACLGVLFAVPTFGFAAAFVAAAGGW